MEMTFNYVERKKKTLTVYFTCLKLHLKKDPKKKKNGKKV